MTRRTSRSAVTVFVTLAALAWSLPGGAQHEGHGGGPEQVCEEPDRSMELFARKRGPNRYAFGLTRGQTRIPGPTIEMTEGECLAITLHNESDRRLSIHPHGVNYTVASDGTPHNRSCVRPGRSRTYVISTHHPTARNDGSLDPGSAGYWHYHDHCMGGPHGTAGIRRGLFGALVVRREGDPLPDHQEVLVMGDGARINLRRAPHTPTPTVNLGDRVEFVVIGHGEEHHTFHLHGHRWTDNRTGMPEGSDDPSPTIDNKSLGPADSFGFQFIAGERVGPGAWMYHCHVQRHADAGMGGLLVVRTPGGTLTRETEAALRAFRAGARVH